MMPSNQKPFGLGAYLKDRVVFLAGTLALGAFLALVLFVLGAKTGAIIAIDAVVVLGAATYLAYDYARQARFWNSLEDALIQADKAQHALDLLDKPSFLEGRLAYEAMQELSSLAGVQTALLKAQAQANSEYIDTWVHEVKTPLAAAELIANKLEGAHAHELKRELERTGSLVQQALFASRLESFSNDYLIRKIGLKDVVQEACKQNMYVLTSLGVGVDISIDAALDVFGDKSQVCFMVSQILINSAKYDATRISISAQQQAKDTGPGCTRLIILDNGCGIPAQDVPRVFERGFTGEVGRAHGSATGMGLYLVARMCQKMELGLTLASTEGTGTRVEISFPHDRDRMSLTGLSLTGL